MKKQGFVVKFLSLVAFRLRGPWPLGYAYDFEIRSRPSVLHKRKTFKAKLKQFFFQNVEESSQVTSQFFETSKNCMTLL